MLNDAKTSNNEVCAIGSELRRFVRLALHTKFLELFLKLCSYSDITVSRTALYSHAAPCTALSQPTSLCLCALFHCLQC